MFHIAEMGFDKAALTYKALLAVAEAVKDAHDGPVQMSFGIRFALAYLYATGRDKNPDMFKRFAAMITNAAGETPHMANYTRGMGARGFLYAFLENAGIEPSEKNQSALKARVGLRV